MKSKSTKPRGRAPLPLRAYEGLRRAVLERDGWRCQKCGSLKALEVHHIELRSHQGADAIENLITLCNVCHACAHEARSKS